MLTVATVAAEESAPWRVAESSVRLLVTTQALYIHSLMVHVPDVLFRHKPSSAVAFLVDGPEIPAVLVDVEGRPAAIEVFLGGRPRRQPDSPSPRAPDRTATPSDEIAVLSEQEPGELTVEIYLRKVEPPRVTLPQAARKPLRVQRFIAPLTARPFTPRELMILEAVQPPQGDVSYMAGFEDAGLEDYSARSGRRRASRLRWSAQLRIPEAGGYRIGADSVSAAWFLFIDGQPLANWKGVEGMGDDLFLAPVRAFSPGFHRVDFYTVLAHGDAPPTLLLQREGGRPGALPLHLMHSADTPESIRMEYKDGALGLGVRVADVQHVLLPQVDGEFVVFTVSADGGGTETPRISVDGNELPNAKQRTVVIRGNRLPELKIVAGDKGPNREQMIVPLQNSYASLRLARAGIDVVDAPLLIGADRIVSIAVRCVLDPWLRTGMGEAPALRVSQLTADGRDLEQETFALIDRDGTQDVAVTVRPDTASIRLVCFAAELALTPDRIVRVVRPGDPIDGVRAAGNQLLADGRGVVLACNPIAKLTPVELASPADRRLVILDDFWAVQAGIDATLLPEEALPGKLGYTVTRHNVPTDGNASAFPGLRKFSLMDQAFASPGDIACFAVGALDLRQGTRPLELCVHLLFLAQAAASRGVQPVFMTLPNMPGVPPAASREAALYTKELGLKLGLPVVDAYSRSFAAHGGPTGFARFLLDRTGTVGLSTPNNDGRRWLCEQVVRTLRQSEREATHE